jgi:hypothetical protein
MALKIPVHYINGTWEMIYGGNIPVREGATGVLQLQEDHIRDSELISILKRKQVFEILKPDTPLMIAVNPSDNLSQELKKHLKTIKTDFYRASLIGSNDQFIEVISGGISLVLEGLSPKGIESGPILLPYIDSQVEFSRTANTLNHALTILSEIYETERISHTGNIYKRVFYKDTNNYWYPIEDLRTDGIDFSEREILKNIWASVNSKLMKKLT